MNRMDFYSGTIVSGPRQINHATTIHVRGNRICIDVRMWERSVFESFRKDTSGKVFRAMAVI